MNFPQSDNHLEHQTTFSPSEHAWVDVLCVGFLILMFQVIRFEHPNRDFPDVLSMCFFIWKTFDVLSGCR